MSGSFPVQRQCCTVFIMMNHTAFAAFALLLLCTPALAAGDGVAVGVKPDAVARGSVEQVLVVGSDVFVGDTVVTGDTGNVQLLFQDQTRLVVGPRSSLAIEAYLLSGSGADRFAVNALAGTFRFISGSSPKSAYSINTPTASIAVRGTRFDVTVGGGQTLTLLFEGALTQCQGSTCVDLTERCDIAISGNGIAAVLGWPDEQREPLVGNFPLPNIQSAFLPDFRVAGAQACLSMPNLPASPPDEGSDGAPVGGQRQGQGQGQVPVQGQVPGQGQIQGQP
jgi:hypothetical protein